MKNIGWQNKGSKYQSYRHALSAKGIKNKSFLELRQMGIPLSAGRDADGDGVVNCLDCAPLNPHRHYSITSISDKDKISDLTGAIQKALREKGFKVNIGIKNGAISLSDIRLAQGHNAQYSTIGSTDFQNLGKGAAHYRLTGALAWDDWVKVNDTVNDVLDKFHIQANVKAMHGKFDIRSKEAGRRSESDWSHLAGENVGSMVNPIAREDYIVKPEQAAESLTSAQRRKAGVKKPEGTLRKMTITGQDTKHTVISDDPLAYSFGFMQGKSGRPMEKAEKGDKLASEYIRGYKAGKKESGTQ